MTSAPGKSEFYQTSITVKWVESRNWDIGDPKFQFLLFLVDLDEESSELVSGTKSEPQSPTSCCQSIFESLELGREPDISISVDFPDLKPLYHKTQSRVNRQSRQRVVKGKIKVRVTTRGHQLQTIEVYVERTPDAAHLVGDKCGRVYLKPQTGPYFPSKVKEIALQVYMVCMCGMSGVEAE